MQNSILSLFLTLKLENSFNFHSFFKIFELPWPFRQIGRIVNKANKISRPAGKTLRWAGVQSYLRTQQCQHCESGPKSLLPLLKCNIPKKYRKCPKSPIICLSTLSGRGYQVMSRFRLGVPDRKVAQLWCSVSVISFSKSFKIG